MRAVLRWFALSLRASRTQRVARVGLTGAAHRHPVRPAGDGAAVLTARSEVLHRLPSSPLGVSRLRLSPRAPPHPGHGRVFASTSPGERSAAANCCAPRPLAGRVASGANSHCTGPRRWGPVTRRTRCARSGAYLSRRTPTLACLVTGQCSRNHASIFDAGIGLPKK